MTVWSAAKLRILRPQIFERVQQELLRPHRSLDYVSSENLVTIAWSFRSVDYNAPRLFKSVWDQSQRRCCVCMCCPLAGQMRVALWLVISRTI